MAAIFVFKKADIHLSNSTDFTATFTFMINTVIFPITTINSPVIYFSTTTLVIITMKDPLTTFVNWRITGFANL